MSLTLGKKLIIAFVAVLFCCAFGFGCSRGQTSEGNNSYILKFVSDGRTYDITAVKADESWTKPADPHKKDILSTGGFLTKTVGKIPSATI